MTPLVEARSVGIEGRLQPCDLAFGRCELVAVVGPNGGGKTSLLRALAQVDGASGEVRINGASLREATPNTRVRLVGLLPASRDLVWPIRVEALARLGHSGSDGKLRSVFADLELSDLTHRRVDRLSTGERSRALLARLFAAAPKLYLLDEPLSNLDPYWVRQILLMMARIVRQEDSSAIVSLHDLAQLHAFDRVLAIAEGKIRFDGRPGSLLDSHVFAEIFRLSPEALGLSPSADPRSSR